MIKSAIALAAAAPLMAAPALAGPYVNVETNAGWTGGDYTGATTDLHVGYEGPVGESASYYVQVGASVVSPDGAESDTVPSGKAGLGVALATPWVHTVNSPSSVLVMPTLTVVMVVSWVLSMASDIDNNTSRCYNGGADERPFFYACKVS